jgi:cadmium resistance protein CadD (predicted permease)
MMFSCSSDSSQIQGQYAGITALFGVSVVASLLSLVIPRAYLGLLGIAPILIGTKQFLDLYRQRDKTEETLERRSDAGAFGRIATVALVTMANGGDNIGIYAPSFAIRSRDEIAVIALVFVATIRRYGHGFAPIVLIGLGILIIYQAG